MFTDSPSELITVLGFFQKKATNNYTQFQASTEFFFSLLQCQGIHHQQIVVHYSFNPNPPRNVFCFLGLLHISKCTIMEANAMNSDRTDLGAV